MSFWDKRKAQPPEHRHNDQWCERHWAPYRKANPEGVRPNGIFAGIQLIQEFIDSPMVLELQDRSPEALTKVMQDGDKSVCCRLGDEVMDRILAEATKLGTKHGAAA